LEILLVMRIVLGRLVAFNKEQIGKLFGEHICAHGPRCP
jgi:hypothetical protein